MDLSNFREFIGKTIIEQEIDLEQTPEVLNTDISVMQIGGGQQKKIGYLLEKELKMFSGSVVLDSIITGFYVSSSSEVFSQWVIPDD